MGTSRDLAMAQISKALAEIGMSYGGGALSASLADSAKGMVSQAVRKKEEKKKKKKKGSGLVGTTLKVAQFIPGPQQPFVAAASAATSAYDAGIDIANKDYLSAGLNVAGAVGGASNISKGLNRGADGLGAGVDPVTGAVTQSTVNSGLSAVTSRGQALTKAGRFSSGLGVVAPKRHSMEFRNTDPGGPFSGFPVGAVAHLPEGIGSPTRDLQLKDNLDPNILPAGTLGDPDRTLDNRTLKARLQDARQRGMPLTSQLGMVGERVAQRLGGGPKWQEFSRQVGQQLPTMISQAQSQKSSTPGAGDVVGMGYQAVADMNREKIQQEQFDEVQEQRQAQLTQQRIMHQDKLKQNIDLFDKDAKLKERLSKMRHTDALAMIGANSKADFDQFVQERMYTENTATGQAGLAKTQAQTGSIEADTTKTQLETEYIPADQAREDFDSVSRRTRALSKGTTKGSTSTASALASTKALVSEMFSGAVDAYANRDIRGSQERIKIGSDINSYSRAAPQYSDIMQAAVGSITKAKKDGFTEADLQSTIGDTPGSDGRPTSAYKLIQLGYVYKGRTPEGDFMFYKTPISRTQIAGYQTTEEE